MGSGPSRRRRVVVGALAALLSLGCTGEPEAGADARGAGQPAPPPSHPRLARATDGMVVSGSSYATEAGRRMLARGGNAIDAAVAVAFALAVVEPTQSGLGGRTQMLVRLADGTALGIDGTTQVPSGYDPSTASQGEHGHAAVGIPGTVAALGRALAEHGTLSLADVIEPALGWARDGMLVSAGEAGRLGELADEIEPGSAFARAFLRPDGRAPGDGDPWQQPDLARTLQTLAVEGVGAFYRGTIAAAIAEDMAAHGGYVTAADLAGYEALSSPAGRGSYRGLEVLGTYLPASGITVIEMLQILDRLEVPAEDASWAAQLAQALAAGFEDRELAEVWAPERAVAWLLSDSLADRRAREIRSALESGAPAVPDGGSDVRESPYTTHVSVADTFGNVVALTQSLGPTGGARVVTPGLGFVYASTLGGYLSGGRPGYRPWSSQAPVVLLADGAPRFVMGGAGARRIVSALVATVTRLADHRLGVADAIEAPRIHVTGGRVQVEEEWPARDALRGMGYDVDRERRSYFARLNVIEIAGPRTFVGVADSRWPDGAAAGPGG